VTGVAQDDKAGWTGDRDRAASWAQFDALPVGIKRVYWLAPYEYTPIPAYRAMAAGEDLRALARQLLAGFAADVRREVARIYGPSHPQACA
jgi:hypothetical protein